MPGVVALPQGAWYDPDEGGIDRGGSANVLTKNITSPADALTKRPEDGIVTVDAGKCLGKEVCGLCLDACLYDAPQFGAEEDAAMQKCDLCLDRWAEGKKPICVTSCPMEAIDAGPLDELRARYGDCREAEGFRYEEALAPSITFTPKKDDRNLAPFRVRVTPEIGSPEASTRTER